MEVKLKIVVTNRIPMLGARPVPMIKMSFDGDGLDAEALEKVKDAATEAAERIAMALGIEPYRETVVAESKTREGDETE